MNAPAIQQRKPRVTVIHERWSGQYNSIRQFVEQSTGRGFVVEPVPFAPRPIFRDKAGNLYRDPEIDKLPPSVPATSSQQWGGHHARRGLP